MALQIKADSESMAWALVVALNAFRREFVETETSFAHADITGTPNGDYRHPDSTPYLVAAGTPTTLAMLRTKCQQIYRVIVTHFADAGDAGAHKNADATNVIVAGLPSDTADQTALNTFLNQAKVACNGHVDETDVHFTDDGTNTVAAADATDAASSYVLADAIDAFLDAHIALAPTSPSIKLLGV